MSGPMSGTPTPVVNTPAQGAAAAGAATNQTSVGDAALRELPPKLSNLTRPVVVTGTVAGETPDGLTRVRTAVGDVLMKSPTPLAADKPVTLQIPAGSPPDRAMVLAPTTTGSGGQPAAQPAATPSVQSGMAGAVANAGTGNAGTTNAGGQQSPVVVLANTSQPAAPIAAGPPLTVGGVISALVLAANPKPQANPAPPMTAASGGSRTNPATTEGASSAGKTDAGGQTSAATAAPRAGSSASTLSANTQGQAVELGGDAAHPGTFTPRPTVPQGPDPGPAPRSGDGAEGRSATGGHGGAPREPAAPAADDEGAGPPRDGSKADAPGKPGDAGSAGRPNTTSPPRTTTVGRMALPEMGNESSDKGSAPPNRPGMPVADGARPSPGTRGGSTVVTSEGAKPTIGESASGPFRSAPSATDDAAAAVPRSPPTPAAPELRTGQTLALKVVSVTPPDGPAPAAASPPPSPTDGDEGEEAVIRGTVAGTTPQGRPIVATSDGMLALNTSARPPIGSLLTLRVADPATIGPAGGADAPSLPDYLTGRDWPALRDVLGTLAQIDPALAQSLVQTVLPQPNKKLTAALTFFIAAMRGGDARGWLGTEATRALLQGGKDGVLRRLEREIGEKNRQVGDAAPDEWRGYPIPIYDQSGINAMALHVHPFPDADDRDGLGTDGAKGSRFLLDVELSRLGPIQLDGMVKPPRFDLIMRSRAPLTTELRRELRDIFTASVEAVGFEGGLSFQSDARSWVRLARKGSAGPAVTA